jgi:tetratricopeptide (TPR) repeat protein
VTYGAIALRTARDHFKDGHTLYFAGEYSEAAVELSNAIRLDPEDGETWFALGCAYFKLQDYSRAIECLARGLQRNSAFKEKEIEGCERFPQEGAIVGTEEYLDDEDFKKAAAALEAAVRMNPQQADHWYRMGVVYRLVADREDYWAVDDRESDLRLMSWEVGSGVPASGNNMVIVATDDNGRLHIRIFDADSTLVADTDETKLHSTQTGKVLSLKQRLPSLSSPHVLTSDEKMEFIREVLSIECQTRWHDALDRSIECYKRASGLVPNRVEHQAALGEAYVWLEDYDAAVPYLSDAASLEPTNAELHILLGLSCLKIDDYNGAFRALDAAMRLEPRHPFAEAMLEIMGKCCSKNGDNQIALRYYVEAFQRQNWEPSYYEEWDYLAPMLQSLFNAKYHLTFDIDLEKSEEEVVVKQLLEGASAKDGVSPGDVITAINGQTGSAWFLTSRLASVSDGDMVSLTVQRDRRLVEVRLRAN